MAQQEKILIVDDTPANLLLLGEALGADYEIFVATNGKSALQLVEQALPDLILLDIMMPEMDGLEVCRRLKENPLTREIPIIFVTVMDAVEDETRGLEAGAADYITKPFRLPIVRARVHTHLELKRKTDLLTNLASRDGLTGIFNRRHFDEILELEWRRTRRGDLPLSLILFDIDFFKPYNDNYGHPAGDACLRRVAHVSAALMQRAGDFIARYGGEEFAVILPGSSLAEAVVMAERIRLAVADLQLKHGYSSIADHLTISTGVASLTDHSSTDPQQLVQKADSALYAAKQAGRNRTLANEK